MDAVQYEHGKHPNSLANLRPKPWAAGQSGNPKGRPAAGAVMIEWLDVMEGWSEDEIAACAEDPKAPVSKRAAARTWLDAISRDRTTGNSPIAGPEFDRIADRTVGQAVKRQVTISGNLDQHNPAEIVAACKVLGVPQAKWPVRALEYARQNGLLGDTANAEALPAHDPTADTPQTQSPRSVESKTL